MLTSAAEQRRFFEDQEEGKAKSSPGNQEAQKCGQSPLSLSVTNDVANLSSQTATKYRER